MNKESDNLYAEQVLKSLGAERFGAPGSAEKGIQAVKMFLDTLGVKPEGYRLVDGSGLSRGNSLSPEVLVKVLAWMYRQFQLSPEFVSTLPVAGEDGTLSHRLSQISRLSRAKTGTLKGVSSLAGYAVNKRGEVVAFAVMVNGHSVPASAIRDLQDEVVKKLNSW
jgi:D-alanyl-D-alanine carboxypeptidase/D-alanyl-D-alanine-endopeptidase (penicillin-binding protein 4)